MSIYDKPGEIGLELVAKVDKGDQEGFNILAVWGDKTTGELFYGDDAGCNCCESPFAGIWKRSSLVLLDSPAEFAEHAKVWARYGGSGSRVWTRLGAMMARIRAFEDEFGIKVPDGELTADPEDLLFENDGN